MGNLFTSLSDNASSWFTAVTTIVAAASAVAALTPTPSDDRWVGKIYRLIDMFALNVGRAKDVPPNRRRTPAGGQAPRGVGRATR